MKAAPLRKTLIVGLDGATFDVIDPLLGRGELPNLTRITESGVRARLRSTIPPVTAAAWPSIITGMNPGQHGIFRFEALDHDAYDHSGEFVSSNRIAGRTIFDYVGANGSRVLAAAVPMTYPAWPINGKMLAGYPTPRTDVFYTFPPEWAEEVAARVQPPGRDRSREEMDVRTPDQFLRDSGALLDRMGSYARELMARETFGLAMVVTALTDQSQHHFFHLRRSGAPQADDPIDQVYRMADRFIRTLLEAVGDDCLVAIVSDHGGGPRAEHLFFVNEWLRQIGLLAAPRRTGESLARGVLPLVKRGARLPGARRLWRLLSGRTQRKLRGIQARAAMPDWSKTQAYFVRLSSPNAGINVNLRGREPHGVVEPGDEYEVVRTRLLDLLPTVRHPNGEEVVLNAWKREAVYSGPHLERAPDIILETRPDYEARMELGALWGRTSGVLHSEITGDHRMDGVLALAGRGVFRTGTVLQGASVVDVAPTLLHAMGLPVPANMDGRVLEGAFEPQFLGMNPIRQGPPLDAADVAHEYTPEEEAGIAAALRSLGYVD